MAQVERASAVLFGQPLDQLDAAALEMLAQEIPTTQDPAGASCWAWLRWTWWR